MFPNATIDSLQQQLVTKAELAKKIEDRAAKENRDLTNDEHTEVDRINADFNVIENRLRREKVLATPQRRLTAPADLDDTPRQRITGGYSPGASRETWGWQTPGHFAKAIVDAAKGGVADVRLVNAVTTYGHEATAADGGFAVPPDFRAEIFKSMQSEESLLTMVDQQVSQSNSLVVPTDSTTPWGSGGITANWAGEAQTLTASKPQLGQVEVKLNKLTAFVPVTDELLEDAPALARYLPGKIGDKMTSKLNDAFVNGTGVGQPQGMLASPSLVTVAAVSGQGAGTVIAANVMAMWRRMYAPLRKDAVWLINQDLESQLMSLVLPGGTTASPLYLPGGSLIGPPSATLMGRPVIALEACQAAGTLGDVILVAPRAYLACLKASGVRAEWSAHFAFDQDVNCFRVILRVGGQSWWGGKATRANGTNNEVSNIVGLSSSRT